MQQIESNFQYSLNTPERLITLDEVESITGFKSSYIYARIQKGLFPQPVKIGTSSRWKFSEVQNWVYTKIKGDIAAKRAGVRL